MAKLKFALVLAAATVASTLSARSTPGRLVVFPRTAQSLTPISLSELVFLAIPSGRTISWDALQIPAVRWLSQGIESTAAGWSFRKGEARVRAGGTTAKILRQSWEELAWGIELSSEDLPKWGAKSIVIRPGFDGNYSCFGTGFEGCEFPSSALQGPKLALRKICAAGPGSNRSEVFAVRTVDGRTATVIYNTNSGSGGASNLVEIVTSPASESCAEAARDE